MKLAGMLQGAGLSINLGNGSDDSGEGHRRAHQGQRAVLKTDEPVPARR
jgi:hypothetical protein